VNNAGITWGGPFLDFPEEKGWDNIFNVNVKSIFYSRWKLSKLSLPFSYITSSDFWVRLLLPL
jgi:NAD(P)-dependent dehydrogenase (short-subunit alcohol dehydrogenase family)